MKRVLAIAIAMLLLVPASVSFASTLTQRIHLAQIKAERLQRQLHQKRIELDTATTKVTDLQGQLDQTNAAISQVNGQLSDLAAQEHTTQAKLDWNAVQLRGAQRSLERQNDLLRNRLVSIYENGDLTYMNVLLSAHSFSEFVERWEDLRLLVAANQRTVYQRRATANKVASLQRNLEQMQMALQAQQQAQTQAETQLNSLSQERQNLVQVADQQRHGVAVQVEQMENLTAAEEAYIEDLIRERQAEIAAQQRAAGIVPTTVSAPGTLSWPLHGPITSPFGWRSNPFGGGPDFHQGIDIGVDTGTTVSAAASGTVIMAQWYGGYGNYILIDHGGGIATGYGHLSHFYVSAGQQVQRGQAIAASGDTGYSTGPHLHFEVRRNGKPIDPAPWLR